MMATKPPKPPPSQRPPPPPEATELDGPAKPSPAVAPEPTTTTPTPHIDRALLPSLDFEPASEQQQGGQQEQERTGARSSKYSLSSIERRRKFMGRVGMGLVAAGFLGGSVYMGREWADSEAELKRDSELAGMTNDWMGRAQARLSNMLDYMVAPVTKEILPKPQHKPYTLLLSLDDLLITSTWDRQNGWRTAKRPGVDYFIAYLSQFYEVVIFTSQPNYTGMPIIEQLDPYGQFIVYRICREYTRSIGGKIVKDLAYLNRDLSKVILIDTQPDHISAQPENAILMPKWTGDPKDKGLVNLIPFLESIGIMHPQDVRAVLKAYEGKDIPSTFAALEAESKRRHIEAWEKKHPGHSAASSGAVGRVSFGSLFGGSSHPVATDPRKPPPTYLELKRMEAQEVYRREQQWLAENEPELKRLIEQDKAAQMAEMNGSLIGALTGSAFKPKDDASASSPPPPESTPSAESK